MAKKRYTADKKVDSKEVDSKEVDSKEVDSKEVDSKEVDSKEVDSKEVDSKEVDSKEVDSKEVAADVVSEQAPIHDTITLKKSTLLIFYTAILVIGCIANEIIANDQNGATLMYNIFIGIADTLTMMTYILLVDTPVLAMLAFVLAQIATFTGMMFNKKSAAEAFSSLGLTFIIAIIVLIGFIVWGIKRGRLGSENSTPWYKSFFNSFLTKRTIIKAHAVIVIITFCIILSTIFAVAQSSSFTTENTNIYWRLYSAAAVIMPIVLVAAIMTTSTIAFLTYEIYIILEIITIVMLYAADMNYTDSIIYIALQLSSLIVAYIFYIKQLKEDKEKIEVASINEAKSIKKYNNMLSNFIGKRKKDLKPEETEADADKARESALESYVKNSNKHINNK